MSYVHAAPFVFPLCFMCSIPRPFLPSVSLALLAASALLNEFHPSLAVDIERAEKEVLCERERCLLRRLRGLKPHVCGLITCLPGDTSRWPKPRPKPPVDIDVKVVF